jgi:site-specific recombinase XerD
MGTSLAIYDIPAAPIRQADTDRQMLALWLHRSASARTRRNYSAWADRFIAFVNKPLAAVTVGDLQAFAQSLQDKASATQALAVSAVKSLLSCAYEVGYLRFNPGRVVKAPPVKRTLAERILSEADLQRLLHLEPDRRNRALLTLIYAAGLRVSEAVGLCWRDLQARDNKGQLTIMGKGGKTRAVLVSPTVWALLQNLPQGTRDAPVFRSRKAGGLDPSQVHRIVKAAARRAGVSEAASCHWLRHAHASHALDRGAPIHLVQATLGHASVATTGVYTHAKPTESSGLYLAV